MNIPSVKVLDKGYVKLIDTFGDELEFMNASSVSLSRNILEITHNDYKNLAENNNVTPLFHEQVKMRIKMPIFLVIEWFRNEVGFAHNQISLESVDYKPEMYSPNKVRTRNRESKPEFVHQNSIAVSMIRDINDRAIESYEDLIRLGTAPEIARTVLPQGMYTEFIETGTLTVYARLCRLRLDPAESLEIRLYAAAVSSLLMEKFPVSWRNLMQEAAKDEENVASALLAPLEKMPSPPSPSPPPPPPSPPEQAEWIKKLIAHINQC